LQPDATATPTPRIARAADIAMAAEWASFYRFRGMQPLPSSPEQKRPMVRYGQWWDQPCPHDLFLKHPTTNVQVMTGRRWKLLVIDLDGDEAIAHWDTLCPGRLRTWITHSGGGGRHLWFTLPANCAPLPKARLWGIWDESLRDGKGDWKPRAAIERLCDRSLVMAPPSIHPRTGQRYRFLAGCSPKDIPMPALIPAGILAMEPLKNPRVEWDLPDRMPRKAPGVPQDAFFYTALVLESIYDKIALARRWGLRIAYGRPNAAGWCSCHAIGREDRTPSASFHATSGVYWEPDMKSLGFFELAVVLGVYQSWRDACNDLGMNYCPHLGRNRIAPPQRQEKQESPRVSHSLSVSPS